jgi:hypothetical protein
MLSSHFFKNTKKKNPKSIFRIRKWTKINVQNHFVENSFENLNSLHLPTRCRIIFKNYFQMLAYMM